MVLVEFLVKLLEELMASIVVGIGKCTLFWNLFYTTIAQRVTQKNNLSTGLS